MLQVFNTCKHFIRTIPNLVYDESNVEDIDTRRKTTSTMSAAMC